MDSAQTGGIKASENILLDKDGKYHWYYEFKLMKNPVILFLLWKMFFWITFAICLLLIIFESISGRMDWLDFTGIAKSFFLIYGILWVLTMLGYLLYAAIQGFKYGVLFEMDDKGVTHTQVPRQFKKAKTASYLTMLLGAASGKPGVVGTGILSASKQSMSSSWEQVRSVEIIRRHNVIKVNERLNKNQVYALPADFPFVEQFIRSHVGKKCRVVEK